MTPFVNEDATVLCAVSKPMSIDDSTIEVAGTDIEREIISTITEHTYLTAERM